MININDLVGAMQKAATQVPKSTPVPAAAADYVKKHQKEQAHAEFELDDDGEEYTGIGLEGVLAGTEKLLAINRGLDTPDERDSLRFQKILRPHSMLRESIKMDAGKTARTALYMAAKRKNLQGMTPYHFDSYVERLMVGNPLTTPLEEINPMQLVENARRITKMGPGGVGNSQSISADMQNVHPSQFGFIAPTEGPESERAGVDVRAASGTKLGSDGRIYQKFWDRRQKKMRWMNPEQVSTVNVKIPD